MNYEQDYDDDADDSNEPPHTTILVLGKFCTPGQTAAAAATAAATSATTATLY